MLRLKNAFFDLGIVCVQKKAYVAGKREKVAPEFARLAISDTNKGGLDVGKD